MKYHDRAPLRHVGDIPAMGAERYGGKLAIEYRGDEYSYADLEARSNQVADALTDAGVEKQAAVAAINERQQALGITIEVAAVLYARRRGIAVDDAAERARTDLLDRER